MVRKIQLNDISNEMRLRIGRGMKWIRLETKIRRFKGSYEHVQRVKKKQTTMKIKRIEVEGNQEELQKFTQKSVRMRKAMQLLYNKSAWREIFIVTVKMSWWSWKGGCFLVWLTVNIVVLTCWSYAWAFDSMIDRVKSANFVEPGTG